MDHVDYLALRWLPYMLVPSEPENGRDKPAIMEFALPPGQTDWFDAARANTWEHVRTWSIDVVGSNLAYGAIDWHRRANDSKLRGYVELADLRQWIDQTRNLAKRGPFGGRARDLMFEAAAYLEKTLDSPTQFFDHVPTSINTKRHADFCASIYLWALDQLTDAINRAEDAWAKTRAAVRTAETGEPDPLIRHVEIATTKFWPDMFGHVEPAPSFADYAEAKKRIARLTVKPDMADAAMRAILRQTLEFGPFGADGRRREGTVVH